VNEKYIAFYSPMKPVEHRTPSGDRLMARLLVNGLEHAGFRVQIASQLRVFLRQPYSQIMHASLIEQANVEIQRLSTQWEQFGKPQLWFCYHPYYKSPDLIGPSMCQRFNVPYVTAEASYSKRRSQGEWGVVQASVLSTISHAAINICLTERDRQGLRAVSANARLAMLPPFIDTTKFTGTPSRPDTARLVSVAMMRAGDKMDSYTVLAAALERLLHLPWTISIVGDGPLRSEVHALFSAIPQERLQWHGLLEQKDIAQLLYRSTLYVWPGCGEAYGLAYLEAQASGVPVAAFDTAGVPEVVDHGITGVLTPEGNEQAYATAISRLLCEPQLLKEMSSKAALNARQYHSLEPASAALREILEQHVGVEV